MKFIQQEIRLTLPEFQKQLSEKNLIRDIIEVNMISTDTDLTTKREENILTDFPIRMMISEKLEKMLGMLLFRLRMLKIETAIRMFIGVLLEVTMDQSQTSVEN
ncbi:MAG: hypothetical protein CMJ17_15870 [Phenylobacterium sp.]|nr:hypothetical protein [Phenylobacterium sp.]